jgi:hypothetical protein
VQYNADTYRKREFKRLTQSAVVKGPRVVRSFWFNDQAEPNTSLHPPDPPTAYTIEAMNRNRSSQKYITLCLGEEHTHLPERIPFYPRQNFFRMPLLLVLSLIASIAAPLCSGADKVMGATADSTRTEAPTEQPATGKLHSPERSQEPRRNGACCDLQPRSPFRNLGADGIEGGI